MRSSPPGVRAPVLLSAWLRIYLDPMKPTLFGFLFYSFTSPWFGWGLVKGALVVVLVSPYRPCAIKYAKGYLAVSGCDVGFTAVEKLASFLRPGSRLDGLGCRVYLT